MSRKCLFTLGLACFLVTLALPSWTQETPKWPKIYPSYSEDFKDFKTYPTLCFKDVFLDGDGNSGFPFAVVVLRLV
ncbi:MAG: hypothetical protein AAFZ63_03255 [Bacteroidota bacterium]